MNDISIYQVNSLNNDALYIAKNLTNTFVCSWNEAQFLNECEYIGNTNILFIAKLNNIPVGFIFLKILYDELHILNLSTNCNYLRQNIATTLLTTSINCYSNSNLKLFTLEVNVNNIAAINLYSKNKFKIITTRKEYYLNKITNTKEDAYIMNYEEENI